MRLLKSEPFDRMRAARCEGQCSTVQALQQHRQGWHECNASHLGGPGVEPVHGGAVNQGWKLARAYAELFAHRTEAQHHVQVVSHLQPCPAVSRLTWQAIKL